MNRDQLILVKLTENFMELYTIHDGMEKMKFSRECPGKNCRQTNMRIIEEKHVYKVQLDSDLVLSYMNIG